VSTSPRPFVAVLFDLDGVIVDTARLHYAAWKRLADGLGLHFDEQRNQHLKGVDRLGSLDLLLGPEASHIGPAERQRLADQKNRWYMEALNAIGSGDLLPGAHDALDEVRRAGLRTGLVSASRNAKSVLDRLRVADRFDVIVDPSGVAQGKPAPDIFLTAARELGATPTGCLGIEDAAAGVAGLKAASMAALGVGTPLELHQADWVIPDLTYFRLDAYGSAT